MGGTQKTNQKGGENYESTQVLAHPARFANGTPVLTGTNGSQRYVLSLPKDLYQEVKRVAQAHHLTSADILRKYIKLGLLVEKMEGGKEGIYYKKGKTLERLRLI